MASETDAIAVDGLHMDMNGIPLFFKVQKRWAHLRVHEINTEIVLHFCTFPLLFHLLFSTFGVNMIFF